MLAVSPVEKCIISGEVRDCESGCGAAVASEGVITVLTAEDDDEYGKGAKESTTLSSDCGAGGHDIVGEISIC